MSGQYPNTFYRVSVKALIKNEMNEILLVKEKAPFWNLPGGGLNHGETIHDSLARELQEEALINESFTEKILTTESIWLEPKQAWLLWLVYNIQFDSTFNTGAGKDADAVAFINPATLKDSDQLEERLIYKLSRNY